MPRPGPPVVVALSVCSTACALAADLRIDRRKVSNIRSPSQRLMHVHFIGASDVATLMQVPPQYGKIGPQDVNAWKLKRLSTIMEKLNGRDPATRAAQW